MNTLSLIYRGIQMTYGMSIDYLGYRNIRNSYIQRGGTLITRRADGNVDIAMARQRGITPVICRQRIQWNRITAAFQAKGHKTNWKNK